MHSAMKFLKSEFVFVAILFILLTILIFRQFFIKGLYPFPGDFLLAWYEPWKAQFFSNGAITIVHKPIADDIFRQIYPFKILASDLIRDFSFPLWNPYNGAGMPLMATMHIGFLNPFNVLFLILSGPLAWIIYIMIQPALIGTCTYFYCQKINLSKIASLFASLTFMLSGFTIARIIYGEYIYVLAMLPLALYLTESFIDRQTTKKIFFLPLVIFFLFVSGQPQMIFYVLMLLSCYVIYRIKHVRNILFIIFLFFIGFGLSALQILPTFELFQNAAISPLTSRFIFERFLLPPQHLLSLLIPNYFGNQATYNYWGSGDYIETISALGLIPSFFAYFALTSKKTFKGIDVQKFFLATVILTILSTLNSPLTKLLFSIPLPILATGVPSRVFSLTTFAMAILAGYGFDGWLKNQNTKFSFHKIVPFTIFIFFIILGTALFYILGVSCHNKFVPDCRLVALRNTFLEVVFFSLTIGLFVLYGKKIKRKLRDILPFIIITFVVVLGLYNSNKFLPFSKKETFLPENNLISALEKYTRDARVLGLGGANIKTDFATHFKFYDPNYYDPLYNKRYGELIAFANNGIVSSSLLRSDIEVVADTTVSAAVKARRDRLLDLLGVKYVIYKKSEIPKSENVNEKVIWEDEVWYIKRDNNVLPHVYLVSDFESIEDNKRLLNRLFESSFNPHTTVLIEKDSPSISSSFIDTPNNKVVLKNYKENTISLETATESDQLLVISDNYYPGWKAFIDGQETSIYRANYTFRSIFLPKGHHSIKFLYQPLSLQIGILISLFSGFLYLLTIIFWPKISSEKNHR